jgi:hypothetical protein
VPGGADGLSALTPMEMPMESTSSCRTGSIARSSTTRSC